MPAEKTQPFCPCSRVLNWTGKGLIQAWMVHNLRPTLYSWWPWGLTSFKTLDRQLPFHEHHCRTANRRMITWHKTVDFHTPFSIEFMRCFSDAPWSQVMFAIRRAAVKCKTCNQAATSSSKFYVQCEPYFMNQWGNGFAPLNRCIH